MAPKFSIPKFPVVKESLHNELRKRVQQYFDENNILQTGNFKLYLKAILLVSCFIGLYVHLVFFTPSTLLCIIECVLLGGTIAAIGFNVMHDGSHGSFSTRKHMNKLAAYSISMLGANHFMWNMKHNMIHHTFTNVDGVDDDIEVGALMRMAPTQKKYMLHRFQHVYFWFLYSLLYVFWIFFTDYKKYFTKHIGQFPIKPMSVKEHIMFWVVKIYHALVFIIVPIWQLGWASWLVGFLVATLIAGFVLSKK